MNASAVHIASFLVHARSEKIEQAIALARTLPGASTRRTRCPAKFAVVLECASEREIAECIERVQNLPGVVCVSMSAHFTDDSSSDPEIP